MPEIAEHIPREDDALARRQLVARSYVVPKGRWRPSTETAEPGYLGLLVLSGLLTRAVVMHEPLTTELVGRGDLLRVADVDGEDAPIPFDVAWQVSSPVRFAVLDAGFTRRVARWPSVAEFVVKAMTSRAHSLAVSVAISRLRHVDLRLLVLLWYLADRWGRVRPDGVCVPLQLTHETLGRLIGARRPTVTMALRGLTQEGSVSRSRERYWVLHGDPPQTKRQIAGPRDADSETTAMPPADQGPPVDHHVADARATQRKSQIALSPPTD